MLSEFELSALILAAEVESCVRTGVPLTSACINALDKLRKAQMQNPKFGSIHSIIQSQLPDNVVLFAKKDGQDKNKK